jgi:hypothetical protein
MDSRAIMNAQPAEADTTRSRARIAAAAIAGLATWSAIVWLAGLFITLPAGAYVFVVVLVATMVIAGFFLPLSGFGTGSAAIGIGFVVAGVVSIFVMKTPFWPLLLGVAVLMIAVTPSIMIAMLVLGE